jgi:hypothetical protein
MGIKANLPIKIKVDNVVAIYLGNNFSLSQNIKYVDIRRHFVWEHQEEGAIDATFVRLEDNKADILTKHTLEEIFLLHQRKLMHDVRTIK